MRKNHVLILLAIVAVLAGCSGGGDSTEDVGSRLTREEIASSVQAAMDPAADPCDDFYRYACGAWLDTTELPADQGRWTRMSELRERNQEHVRDILESADGKLGWYYGSCMDEAAIDARGADPLAPWLERIDAVDGSAALMATAADLQMNGIDVLFSAEVEGDLKNPDVNIAHIFQGGLGLPDRDYYLEQDDRSKGLRTEYVAHVTRMLTMLGDDDATAAGHADAILAFETALAEVSKPRVELRDPYAIYHMKDVAELKQMSPDLAWDAYLETVGLSDLERLNVATPDFFAALGGIVSAADPDTIKAYLRWHALTNTAQSLSAAFAEEDFAFYGKALSGRKEQRPRWKRCVSSTDRAMGEMLGQAFVDQYFAGDSKGKALEMIEGIEGAFAANLPDLAWMDDTTRERANEKMELLENKIGYPDTWRDYGALEVSEQGYFENRLAGVRFETARQLAKIGNPVDRDEWGMSPPTVNAYYHPLRNQMVFPAGILQDPSFHRDFPAAMNFGAIGMVMGHELSHGFDDSGRKFDGHGTLTEWWEPAVAARYEERAQCVADLYDTYEVEDGLAVNGKLTLGENIADLGGIKQAFMAYRQYQGAHGSGESFVEGLTDDQLFFVAYAQLWCAKSSPEMARMLIKTDTHSPPKYRVIGPLSQFDGFAESFQCESGTVMNPEHKCEVW